MRISPTFAIPYKVSQRSESPVCIGKRLAHAGTLYAPPRTRAPFVSASDLSRRSSLFPQFRLRGSKRVVVDDGIGFEHVSIFKPTHTKYRTASQFTAEVSEIGTLEMFSLGNRAPAQIGGHTLYLQVNRAPR